jgi:3-dehydroquinate synthase
MITDSDFFKFLEEKWWDIINLEPETTSFIVKRSCQIKADVVSRDEKEGGLRRILNFGHTIGHAVEALSAYTKPHGEAVSICMVAVSRLSLSRGMMTRAELDRLRSLLEQLRLPVDIPADMDRQEIVRHMKRDKKVRDGRLHFILTKGIGETVIVNAVTKEELEMALGA